MCIFFDGDVKFHPGWVMMMIAVRVCLCVYMWFMSGNKLLKLLPKN